MNRLNFQECRKITDNFRGIYRIYPNLIKETRRKSTCNRLDLQTLGSQPVVMPKNLPDHCLAMIGENRQLVRNEPVEFERQLIEVQDCRETTDHFRWIYRIHPNLIKENRRMSTCNHRLDWGTLGSQPVVIPAQKSPRPLLLRTSSFSPWAGDVKEVGPISSS